MCYLSQDNSSLGLFKLKHSGAVFRNIMVGDRTCLVARTVEKAEISPVSEWFSTLRRRETPLS